MNRLYKNDDREVTMEKIERILIREFGGIMDSGCYQSNGKWFSLYSILEAISREV